MRTYATTNGFLPPYADPPSTQVIPADPSPAEAARPHGCILVIRCTRAHGRPDEDGLHTVAGQPPTDAAGRRRGRDVTCGTTVAVRHPAGSWIKRRSKVVAPATGRAPGAEPGGADGPRMTSPTAIDSADLVEQGPRPGPTFGHVTATSATDGTQPRTPLGASAPVRSGRGRRRTAGNRLVIVRLARVLKTDECGLSGTGDPTARAPRRRHGRTADDAPSEGRCCTRRRSTTRADGAGDTKGTDPARLAVSCSSG
jgi:hypothetical protein